jgi:metallo-beta-lactamase family protein
MLDAGHLQEEEARSPPAARRGNHRAINAPLFNEMDALNSLDYFGRTARYDRPLELAPGVRATFIDAGHILGSACIFLELEEKGRKRTVLFSGDLGNSKRPILRTRRRHPGPMSL